MKDTDKKIKDRLNEILDLENRVTRMSNDIKNGDVSPYFLSLMGTETTLISKLSISLQTTFGMSFYEQVCEILASEAGLKVKRQHKILGVVSQQVNDYINKTLDDKRYKPNRDVEVAEIKRLAGKGIETEHPDSTVDVFIELEDGTEIYIDITTVKPNKKEFRAMKRKLLIWTAMRLSVKPDAKVEAYMAIPYNPLQGEYDRFKNLYDKKDLLVEDQLWNLVSKGAYSSSKIKDIFSSLHDEVVNVVDKKIKEVLAD